MRAKLPALLLLAVFLCGCAARRVPVKVEQAVKPPPPLPVPEELVEAGRPLKFLVMWYYRANETWPEQRADLIGFLKTLRAPLTLENYPSVKFNVVSDDEIECRYVFDAPAALSEASRGTVPACRINGMFRMTATDAVGDGIDHMGLEPMLSVECMRLPERTPGSEEPVNLVNGLPAPQPDLSVLDEMTPDDEPAEEPATETE